MMSPNFNNYIQQQQQVTPQQVNSYNSQTGSFNSSYSTPLLIAANTLSFNSPPNNNHQQQQNMSYTVSTSSPVKTQMTSEVYNFRKNLLEIQNQSNFSNSNELDFDLHYTELKEECDEISDEMDLTTEFERAIKNFEEAKQQNNPNTSVKMMTRILNNPINFNKSNDSVGLLKNAQFESSPGNSASFAGYLLLQ